MDPEWWRNILENIGHAALHVVETTATVTAVLHARIGGLQGTSSVADFL